MNTFLMSTFLPEQKTLEQKIGDVKRQRDTLLLISDWTQLSDVPAQTKAKWMPYRQALRDLSQQDDFPLNVVWPARPE
jgi:hypothetical protein